jgi:hypothetical protein
MRDDMTAMLLFMPPYCRCHSDMYDDIRLHYGDAVTSQLFWLAPLSDEILDVVTSKPQHFEKWFSGGVKNLSLVGPC